MRSSTLIRMIVSSSAAASLVFAAPALGDGDRATDRPIATPQTQHDGTIVFHRDGSIAVPFDPVAAPAHELVLRRDGSKAEPFAAAVGQEAGFPNEGFDWRDAMIGVGSTLGLMLLALGALVVIRRRSTGARSAQA